MLTITFGQTASAEKAIPDFSRKPPEYRQYWRLGYRETSKSARIQGGNLIITQFYQCVIGAGWGGGLELTSLCQNSLLTGKIQGKYPKFEDNDEIRPNSSSIYNALLAISLRPLTGKYF